MIPYHRTVFFCSIKQAAARQRQLPLAAAGSGSRRVYYHKTHVVLLSYTGPDTHYVPSTERRHETVKTSSIIFAPRMIPGNIPYHTTYRTQKAVLLSFEPSCCCCSPPTTAAASSSERQQQRVCITRRASSYFRMHARGV